jgi:hypothetical protein
LFRLKTSPALFVLVLLAALLGAERPAQAQGQIRSILFSGFVVGGRQQEPLPGANIFIPRAGRGVATNNSGYFSIGVYPGDSVIFSYIGYQKQYYVIPRDLREDSYSAKVVLEETAITLRPVKIYPYRTEKEFKDAFLATTLADQAQRDALARNTDPATLRQLGIQLGAGSASNYQYFLNQQWNQNFNRTAITTVPFLNPFAWASFINSIKKGDLKENPDLKKAYEVLPNQNTNRDRYIREQSRN